MSLFAKNRPTKRIVFEGAFVVLQYLSKGIKDDLQNQLLAAVKGVDPKVLDMLEKESKANKPKDDHSENIIQKVPTKEVEFTSDIPIEIVASMNEMANYALSKAIVSWSEKEDISIETVRDLDGEIFDKLVDEINEMNNLDLATVKN